MMPDPQNPRDALTASHHTDAQRTALALIVLLSPFLVVGALTTISVFGAVFGVPLLAITIPPAVVAWRARRSPADRRRLRHLAFASTFVAAAITLTIATSLLIGFDDLDTAPDVAAAAIGAGWAAAAWWIVVRARELAASS